MRKTSLIAALYFAVVALLGVACSNGILPNEDTETGPAEPLDGFGRFVRASGATSGSDDFEDGAFPLDDLPPQTEPFFADWEPNRGVLRRSRRRGFLGVMVLKPCGPELDPDTPPTYQLTAASGTRIGARHVLTAAHVVHRATEVWLWNDWSAMTTVLPRRSLRCRSAEHIEAKRGLIEDAMDAGLAAEASGVSCALRDCSAYGSDLRSDLAVVQARGLRGKILEVGRVHRDMAADDPVTVLGNGIRRCYLRGDGDPDLWTFRTPRGGPGTTYTLSEEALRLRGRSFTPAARRKARLYLRGPVAPNQLCNGDSGAGGVGIADTPAGPRQRVYGLVSYGGAPVLERGFFPELISTSSGRACLLYRNVWPNPNRAPDWLASVCPQPRDR